MAEEKGTKPEGKKKISTGGWVGISCGGCLVLVVLLIIISAVISGGVVDKPTPERVAEPTKTQEKVAEPTPTQYVFDVPSLVGKDIDEIRGVLGDPEDSDSLEPNADQKTLGTNEWSNTYSQDGEDLLITFDPNTRKVIDFFIGTSPDRQDKNKLLQIGNLQEGNTAYKIEYVKSLKDPGQITGVKVIPN